MYVCVCVCVCSKQSVTDNLKELQQNDPSAQARPWINRMMDRGTLIHKEYSDWERRGGWKAWIQACKQDVGELIHLSAKNHVTKGAINKAYTMPMISKKKGDAKDTKNKTKKTNKQTMKPGTVAAHARTTKTDITQPPWIIQATGNAKDHSKFSVYCHI